MKGAFQSQNGSVAASINREYALAGGTAGEMIGQPARDPIRTASPAGASLPGTRAVLKVVGTLHRLLYRWSDGRIGRRLRGGPVLLLTTTGRKTGRERTWPLSYVVRGDDLVLVASAGGAAHHPAWYLNLRSNPSVRIQVGGRSRTMVARTIDGTERARLWKSVVRQYPVVAGYQRKTDREIPVVVLHPVASANEYACGYQGKGLVWAVQGLANA